MTLASQYEEYVSPLLLAIFNEIVGQKFNALQTIRFNRHRPQHDQRPTWTAFCGKKLYIVPSDAALHILKVLYPLTSG